MTNCWSEGALRAYLDRELAAEDMKSVAAHLHECSACDALCAELAGRAARVFGLLEALPAVERVTAVAARQVVVRRLWPAAAVAVAAGLAVASFVLPKRETAPPVARVVTPAPQARPVEVAPPDPAVVPVEQAARPVLVRSPKGARRPAASMDYFVALDNDPIESGVIMRMAIQPGNTQADIVFDPGGRARAIRLVSNKY
jgi:hypothetical protein